MSSALVETLAELEARRADRAAAYTRLVELFAGDGVDIDAGEVDEVVRAAGRTLGDLRRDVEARQRRLVARAALDALPEAERDRAEAEADRQAVERERAAALAKLQAEHEAAVARLNKQIDKQLAPVNDRLADARGRIADAAAGEQTLQETAGAALKARLADLRAAQAAAQAALRDEGGKLRERVVEIHRYLDGGVPEPRDERKRPYPPGLEGERLRRDEEQARARRVAQVRNLNDELQVVRRKLRELEEAPGGIAAAVADCLASMLVV